MALLPDASGTYKLTLITFILIDQVHFQMFFYFIFLSRVEHGDGVMKDPVIT